MDWTDKQLEIVLIVCMQADGGCPNCVQNCLQKFIDLCGSEYTNRLKEAFDNLSEEDKYPFEWEMICRYVDEEIE